MSKESELLVEINNQIQNAHKAIEIASQCLLKASAGSLELATMWNKPKLEIVKEENQDG